MTHSLLASCYSAWSRHYSQKLTSSASLLSGHTSALYKERAVLGFWKGDQVF